MKRRDLLHAASLAGLTALSGCVAVDAGHTALDVEAEFEYTPPNPVVGESVVFDGSSSNASEWEWYFDDSPSIVI